MGKKKTGAYMGGGMAKKKGSMYNKGGMPMVMKAGKKVPAFAADGVGKMNMGGMAKKKKPMASTGYKEGGTVKKKETFGQAFKRNRKKFMDSGSAGDYTFKHEGKSYNILQKGETKAGVMKKFSAPKKSLRPKLRPSSGVSENTKKKITSTVRDVMAVKALPEDGPDKTPRKTKPRVANSVRTARKGVGAGSFAGKGAGKDKPKAKPVATPNRKMGRFSIDGKVTGPGQRGRLQKRAAPIPISKEQNSANVREGQAKYRDRAGPQRRARDVTYAEYKAMSRTKKAMLGLPVSIAGGELGFKRFRKGFTGKDYTMKTKP